MYFELLKLIRNRWFLILSGVLLFLLSGLYGHDFYISEYGNDLKVIQNYYKDSESFLKIYEDIPYVEGNSAEEETLTRMLDQKDHIRNIKNLIQDNVVKAGLVNNEFEKRSMQKSASLLCKVQNLKVPVAFHGGAEQYLSCSYSVILASMTAFICCFTLFLQERKEPARLVTDATISGRKTIYRNRILATLTAVFISFVIMEIIQFLIAFTIGMGNLSDPVQSLQGMWLFPYHLTITEWILLSFLIKAFLIGCFSCFLILLSSIYRKEWMFAGIVLLIVLFSFFTEDSSDLWLRSFSLIQIFRIQDWMSSVIFLNLFSYPVNRFWMIVAISSFFPLLVWIKGASFYCLFAEKHRKAAVIPQFNRMSYSLTRNEIRKYWLIHGGILSLFLLCLVQSAVMKDFRLQLSQPEMFYARYAEVLKGYPDEKKDMFIKEEKEMLLNDTTGELYQRRLGFEMAERQYRSLAKGERFADRLSWNWISSKNGISTMVFFLLLLLAGICYPLSSALTGEIETGVVLLQNSSGERIGICRIRRISIFLHILLAWVISFIPLYRKINEIYGFYDLTTKAGLFSYWIQLALITLVQAGICFLYALLLQKLADRVKKKNYVLAIGILLIVTAFLVLLL